MVKGQSRPRTPRGGGESRSGMKLGAGGSSPSADANTPPPPRRPRVSHHQNTTSFRYRDRRLRAAVERQESRLDTVAKSNAVLWHLQDRTKTTAPAKPAEASSVPVPRLGKGSRANQ